MQAKKKIKQTDAIFSRLHELHTEAEGADNVLRMSLDTKATIKIGLFSRGGDNWVEVKALDHDFKPEATLSPFGILLPRYPLVSSKATVNKPAEQADEAA